MREVCKRLYAEARRSHQAMILLLGEIKRDFNGCVDMEDLADAIFAVRESGKLMDDARKECAKLGGDGKTSSQLEAQLCVEYVVNGDGDKIRTEYVTADPDVKQAPIVPRRDSDPEAYDALMGFLGVTPDIAAQGVVRPHWPELVELCTKLLEEGKPLPPGVDPAKTYKICRVGTRRRRHILDDGEAVPLTEPDRLREMYERASKLASDEFLGAIDHLGSILRRRFDDGIKQRGSIESERQEELAAQQDSEPRTTHTSSQMPDFMRDDHVTESNLF